MIRYIDGDIFDSGAEALVNPVNCVGVMGAGLAKQFRERFPENYEQYRRACGAGRVRRGEMFVTTRRLYEIPAWDTTRWIVNFPTKGHWKNPSEIEWIEEGLVDLARFSLFCAGSIAVPQIGCGLGGLLWSDVRPLIERAFAELPDVDVMVYGPPA